MTYYTMATDVVPTDVHPDGHQTHLLVHESEALLNAAYLVWIEQSENCIEAGTLTSWSWVTFDGEYLADCIRYDKFRAALEME